ncbi:MAG: hypothetical protein CMF75_05775 [Maricaulis sp.]|nr:hypothetical protein [Maricaulis sp.]
MRFVADTDGLTLQVRLTPNASRDVIEAWRAASDGSVHLAVKVRAVPEKGKANAALVALLAKQLGLPKRDVDVIRGATSRLKTVRIAVEGAALQPVAALLEAVPDECSTD